MEYSVKIYLFLSFWNLYFGIYILESKFIYIVVFGKTEFLGKITVKIVSPFV